MSVARRKAALKHGSGSGTHRGRGSSHAGRVRALELLGKHLKLFTDRIETAQPVRLQIVEEIVDAYESEVS
jgi:hypothetical protein